MKLTKLLISSVLILAVGCSGRQHKARIYQGADGKKYTRSHSQQDSTFIWWVYNDSCCPITSTGARIGSPWSRVGVNPPSTVLTPTSRVVIEEDAEPTTEVVEEDVETSDIDANTTEAAVDAADSSGDSGGSSGGDSGSSDGGGGGDGGGE